MPGADRVPAIGSAIVPGYWQSRWVRVGIGLLVAGSSPLLLIAIAATIGLWPDPNPIGPGLLFFFTFWPAILCILIGVARVRRARRAVD